MAIQSGSIVGEISVTGNFEHIRARLEAEGRRLADELRSKLSEGGVEAHDGSWFGSTEERADERIELESRLAVVRHMEEQLAEVQHALDKLEKGTYGICDSCGKPIAPARLEAVPQANLCLECKTRQTKSSGR
jgi:RNA polymerase-binding protein DksA